MTGRPYLHLVEKQPRPRHLLVRISVALGLAAFGRSRLFRLSDRDLQELIDTALRLEALSS